MNGNINGNLAYEMEPEEEIIGGEVVMMASGTSTGFSAIISTARNALLSRMARRSF